VCAEYIKSSNGGAIHGEANTGIGIHGPTAARGSAAILRTGAKEGGRSA
jgi:hypothetical protein